MEDRERGLGRYDLHVADEALDHWATTSDGDARRALAALEVAVLSQVDPAKPPEEAGRIAIDLAVAEESIQQKALRYDGTGDEHYDAASALIKSMRGSDPDAAIYWMARMLEAGEDPRFIARRVVICAAEDVGNADPAALMVAVSAMQAVEYVGMPEARIPLAEAVTYIACAPKSNAAPQEYLGVEKTYYEPTDHGREAKLKERLERFKRLRRAGKDDEDDQVHLTQKRQAAKKNKRKGST